MSGRPNANDVDYSCAVEQVRPDAISRQCSRLTIAIIYLVFFGLGYLAGVMT
jgi:hypothetical protein